MSKRIFRLFLITITSSIIAFSCGEDDGVPYTYTSTIDLKDASIVDDQYHSQLLYSSDNGATYVAYPSLEVGKTYKVKVHNTESGEDLTSERFTFDWTNSDPAPNDVTLDMPEFTLAKTNSLKVKIIDRHCAYTASSWVGDWKGLEDGSCCGGTDEMTMVQDPAVANRFILSNFWGDGTDVTAYLDFSPSTDFFTQTIHVPEQETSEGGLISEGSGVYDECAGTFYFDAEYTIDDKTYAWVYRMSR